MLNDGVHTINDRLNAHIYNRDFNKFTSELNRLTLAKDGSLVDEHFNKYDVAQWCADALAYDHSTLISLACAGLITRKGIPLAMDKLAAHDWSEAERADAQMKLEELADWSDALHRLMEQPETALAENHIKAIESHPFGVKDSDFIMPLMASLYHIRAEDDVPDMNEDAQSALDGIFDKYFKGH